MQRVSRLNCETKSKSPPCRKERDKDGATSLLFFGHFGSEEVPGFAVGVVETGAAVAASAEQEAGGADGGDGNDVPGVLGDDVGGKEVDFGGEVGDGASVGAAVSVDAVESVEKLGGAFDLDAVESGPSGW
jgi:hypothetical protein